MKPHEILAATVAALLVPAVGTTNYDWIYEKGIAVKLVRCGLVYTESTNNWYSLTSGKTRPAMILQSIRYDGNQVQDSYSIRLDGTLPARDPRDRNPGVSGC